MEAPTPSAQIIMGPNDTKMRDFDDNLMNIYKKWNERYETVGRFRSKLFVLKSFKNARLNFSLCYKFINVARSKQSFRNTYETIK